jgi:hypothetical protein
LKKKLLRVFGDSRMMNDLILGHSFVTNLRRLCENPEKPHEWEDPGNARGKVSVQMHGYPGGRVKTLITAIEAGLFVHYTPHVVICQIGGNGCSNKFFDEKAHSCSYDHATFFRLGSRVVGVMIHLSFLLIGTLPLLHLGCLVV